MRSFLFLFLFYFTVSIAGSQTIDQQQLERLALRDVPMPAPGLATGVIRNGELVYKRYAGYASLKDSSLIDESTRFNIASNAKQFTAFAILQLEEKGSLKLSDDIRTFLPGLFGSVRAPITIQHLLTHTSGIRDVYDLLSLQRITWWRKTLNNQDLLKMLLLQEDLNFQPGTQYLYSNSNYILLALIIEKVAGTSFRIYTDNMFRMLGMNDTGFEPDHASIRGKIALPYFNFNEWSNYAWLWDGCGDGNLFTTLNDQLHWEELLMGADNKILSSSMRKKMLSVIDPKNTGYGAGLEFGTYKDLPYTFHEGATGAWKATTTRINYKGDHYAFVTMTNSGKVIPSMLTREIMDVVLGLSQQRPSFLTAPHRIGPRLETDQLTGTYLNSTGFSFSFIKKDSSLILKRNGRNDTRLVRESENIFHQWNDPAFKQEFTQNNKGEMIVTAYYTDHAPYSLTRPRNDLYLLNRQQLKGKYLNRETGVQLEIFDIADNEARLKIMNDTLMATFATAELILTGSYMVKIIKGTKAPTLLLSGDRIRNVIFRKEDN